MGPKENDVITISKNKFSGDRSFMHDLYRVEAVNKTDIQISAMNPSPCWFDGTKILSKSEYSFSVANNFKGVVEKETESIEFDEGQEYVDRYYLGENLLLKVVDPIISPMVGEYVSINNEHYLIIKAINHLEFCMQDFIIILDE